MLYGAYSLLRMQAAGQLTVPLSVTEQPAYDLRILNHWDNPDGTVERGYAGRSLWNWEELPGTLSPRYEAYARANASVGINGTVLNNVNASPQVLTTGSLEKVKALADVFRPYGIKVYLSVNLHLLSGWASWIRQIRWTRKSLDGGNKSKRDLCDDPRLWRFFGEGQFGGATGTM